eukprot:gene9201-19079_t
MLTDLGNNHRLNTIHSRAESADVQQLHIPEEIYRENNVTPDYQSNHLFSEIVSRVDNIRRISNHISRVPNEVKSDPDGDGDSRSFATNNDQIVADSLSKVNPFTRLHAVEMVTMIQITADGHSEHRTLTTKSLFHEINKETADIDRHAGLSFNDHASDHFHSGHVSIDDLKGKSNTSYSGKLPVSMTKVAGTRLGIRDLRVLESSSNKDEPAVLVRRHVVVIALGPIRSVIMAKKLILVSSPESASLLSTVEDHMKEWSPESIVDGVRVTVPFELHAYEAILATVKALQTQEYERLKDEVTYVVKYTKKGTLLPMELQERLRDAKNCNARCMGKVRNCVRVLDDIVDNDEEMALMSLSVLRSDPSLYSYPLHQDILCTHEEMEELLEFYLHEYGSLTSSLLQLRSQLQSAEQMVTMKLNTSQNLLLLANTAITIVAVAVGLGGYITGIFGMNLDQTMTIQPTHEPPVFQIVCIVTSVLMVLVFIVFRMYFSYTGYIPSQVVFDAHKMAKHTRKRLQQRFFTNV